MSKLPLLSIIIPTKGRHRQLLETLSAHKWVKGRSEVEIVIADNSPRALQTKEIEKGLGSNFLIKYENSTQEHTITENFRRGLALSSGKFVCFIGDDDFIVENSLAAIQKIDKIGFDCVFGPNANYYWPSCIFHPKAPNRASQLLLPKSKQECQIVNVKKEYQKSQKNGFLSKEKMPRCYHGIVRRSVFEELQDSYNTSIFDGSPDMSIQVSLSLLGVRTFFWNQVICVAGASRGSGGGMTTEKAHCREFNEVTWLADHVFDNWPRLIPRYWSEFTILAATAAYVQKKMGRESRYRFEAVLAAILVNESVQFQKVLTLFKSNVWQTFRSSPLLMLLVVKKLLGRAYRSFKGSGMVEVLVEDVTEISRISSLKN